VETQGGGGGGGSDILSLLGPLSAKLSGVSNIFALHTVLCLPSDINVEIARNIKRTETNERQKF
jgi:hypothetical protein